MSCPPEETLSVYVDGELEGPTVRDVETHLVACQQCRGRVWALREETAALADVLFERPAPARAAGTAPARGLVLGLLPSLGVLALGVSVAGVLIEWKLPDSVGWLNPLRLMGAYRMAFDILFLLRDRAPELFEFALATATLVSVSALMTFGVSALGRRWLGTVGALALGVLLTAVGAPPAQAVDLRLDQESLRLDEGEVLDDTLLVSGETLQIDGIIEGDLIALARHIAIRGEVRGNVFVVGRDLEMSGRVGGSLHTFAERVRITGAVDGSVYSVAERYTLGESGEVERDAAHFGEGSTVEGRVGRDLVAVGEWLQVRGKVGRRIDARIERIALEDEARVGGDLNITFLENEEDFQLAPGAEVAGETTTEIFHKEHPGPFERYADTHFYLWVALQLAAAFLVGCMIYWTVPGVFSMELETGAAFVRALGLGFVALVATPIAMVLLALTLAGLPLAVIGLVVYAAALYLSGIVIAELVGDAVVRSEGDDFASFGLTLLVGLAIVMVAVHIPYLGPLVRTLVILTGLGLLSDRVLSAWRARRTSAA
ncbi:MAG: hypothetical protein MJE66_14590 [Proteobacteria bacterium]|nr:hypothetical protein [Pseudomonadota bacterium]